MVAVLSASSIFLVGVSRSWVRFVAPHGPLSFSLRGRRAARRTYAMGNVGLSELVAVDIEGFDHVLVIQAVS